MNSLQNFALDNDLVLEAGDASYTPTPGQNQNQLPPIATETGIYAALAEGKLAVLANYKLGTRMLVAQIRRRKLQIEFLRQQANFARDEAKYVHEGKLIELNRVLFDVKHTYELNRALAMDPKDIALVGSYNAYYPASRAPVNHVDLTLSDDDDDDDDMPVLIEDPSVVAEPSVSEPSAAVAVDNFTAEAVSGLGGPTNVAFVETAAHYDDVLDADGRVVGRKTSKKCKLTPGVNTLNL